MKTYESQDAIETLAGILALQDKRMLADELAKVMVRQKNWTIRDLDLQLKEENGKFIIKIGGE